MSNKLIWLFVCAFIGIPNDGNCLSLQYHEINRSKYCDSIPPSVVNACKMHKGESTPFRYAVIHSIDECNAINDSAILGECRLKPLGSQFYVQTKSISKEILLLRDSTETQASNKKYTGTAAMIAAPYIAVVAGGIVAISFVYWASQGYVDLNPISK